METTSRHTGRKVLIAIAAIVLVLVVLTLLGLWLLSRPQKIAWGEKNMAFWIDAQVQGEQSSARCLLTSEADIAPEVRSYFDEASWQNNALEYYVQTAEGIRDYRLTGIDYTLEERSGGLLLEAAFTYDTYSFSTADAPRIGSDIEALRYLAEHINADGTPVIFSYESGVLSDAALSTCLTQAVANNTAYGTDDVTCGYSTFQDAADAVFYVYVTSSSAHAESADYTAQAIAALDGLEAQVRALAPTTEEETYRAIEQVVCDTLSYDDALLDITNANANKPDAFTAEELARRGLYGAAVVHKTVCSGYAVTYQALCQRLGVDCWQIFGVNEGEEHVWSMISLNGERWFIDCTFLDTGDQHDAFFTESEYAARGYVADADTLYPW